MPSINLGKVVGDKGTSLRYRGKWNAVAQYVNNEHFIDLVTYQGNLWTCLMTNSSTEPGTGGSEWDVSVTGAAAVANDLLQTEEGYVLDARQGKVLDEKKLDKDRVIESTMITEPGFVMDGKICAGAFNEIKEHVIVEAGSTGNGSYRKYEDGTLQMWGIVKKVIAITNSNTIPYYSAPVSLPFPVESVTPCAVTTDIATNGIIWHTRSTAELDKAATSVRLFAASNYYDASVTFSWMAIGTWK